MTHFVFDAKAALEAARKGRASPNLPNHPNRSAPEGSGSRRLEGLGRLGTVGGSVPETSPEEFYRNISEKREQVRAGDMCPDAGAYLDRLQLHGPATYGAMASAMGWGATRAWRAEAKLRALALISIGELGRAVLTESQKT